jgi:hypothetical protein
MPLGSLSTLGLAGPNGTALIGELPAPADPAGGVSWAYALPGATRPPSSRTRTSTELRNIDLSGAASLTIMWGPRVGIKALWGESAPVLPHACGRTGGAPPIDDAILVMTITETFSR